MVSRRWPSLEKVFGIHVILESGQEFTCSDVDCRRKTVEDLCDLVLRYDIVLEELPYILEDFLLDQYDIAV